MKTFTWHCVDCGRSEKLITGDAGQWPAPPEGWETLKYGEGRCAQCTQIPKLRSKIWCFNYRVERVTLHKGMTWALPLPNDIEGIITMLWTDPGAIGSIVYEIGTHTTVASAEALQLFRLLPPKLQSLLTASFDNEVLTRDPSLQEALAAALTEWRLMLTPIPVVIRRLDQFEMKSGATLHFIALVKSEYQSEAK